MVEISVIIAVIGCFVGLAGWLSNRDKRTQRDAEWRGIFTAKLDSILASVTGLRGDVDKLDSRMNDYGERLATVEASAHQAHKRLDEITPHRKGD